MYFNLNRLIIFILINTVISGYSSNDDSVFINVSKQESNELKVTYKYKNNIPNRNIFYFPSTVMGAYSDIPYTDYISDFVVKPQDLNQCFDDIIDSWTQTSTGHYSCFGPTGVVKNLGSGTRFFKAG